MADDPLVFHIELDTPPQHPLEATAAQKAPRHPRTHRKLSPLPRVFKSESFTFSIVFDSTSDLPKATEMPRGAGNQSKVHYQGKDDDFIVYIDSTKAVQDWLKDRSTPLAQVVDSFQVFVTHKHGAQGVHDHASKQSLENEFGTHNLDDCIIKMLEKGSIQETESAERQGNTNDSMGPRIGH